MKRLVAEDVSGIAMLSTQVLEHFVIKTLISALAKMVGMVMPVKKNVNVMLKIISMDINVIKTQDFVWNVKKDGLVMTVEKK